MSRDAASLVSRRHGTTPLSIGDSGEVARNAGGRERERWR